MTTDSQLSYWQIAKNSSIQEASYTPTQLWHKAADYFEWAEDTPLQERRIGRNGGLTIREKMRLLSQSAFCLYANISTQTFLNYCQQDDFVHITQRIQSTIDTQNMEGAAAGLLSLKVVSQQLETKKQEATETEAKALPVLASQSHKKAAQYFVQAPALPKPERQMHQSKRERAAEQRRMALVEMV